MNKISGNIKNIMRNNGFTVRLDHAEKRCKIRYSSKTAPEMRCVFPYQDENSVWEDMKRILREAENDVKIFTDSKGNFYETEREFITEALCKLNADLSNGVEEEKEEPEAEKEIEEIPGKKRSFTVYTDGGCDVNPGGTGGYGVVVIDNDRGDIKEYSGWEPNSTNNRMEITAAAVGLENVPEGASVILYSDSQYVIFTMQGKYGQNKNIPYWNRLNKASKGKKVEPKWVRGHNGNKYNERCDTLATNAINSCKGEAETTAVQIPVEMVLTVLPEHYPGEKRELHRECDLAINSVNNNEKPSFKDYMAIKVGGRDAWSSESIDDFVESLGEICTELITDYFEGNTKKAETCLRWYGRGLKIQHAIKKTNVDEEVTENYVKNRFKK